MALFDAVFAVSLLIICFAYLMLWLGNNNGKSWGYKDNEVENFIDK